MQRIEYVRERVDKIRQIEREAREQIKALIEEVRPHLVGVEEGTTPEEVRSKAIDQVERYDTAKSIVTRAEKEIPNDPPAEEPDTP